MSKKFVVGIEGLSTEQEELFRDFIRKDGSGWWHWIGGFWLVDAATDELTVSKIRDQIRDVLSEADALVLEVSPITWAAWGPESENRSLSKWVSEFWKADE